MGADEDANQGFVEFNPVLDVSGAKAHTLGVQVGMTHKLSDNFSIGSGVGASMNYKFVGNPIIPIFARAQFDLGYEPTDGTAFYYSPKVGMAFDVRGGKSSLELGVSYMPIKYHEDDADKNPTFSNIGIAVGYTF